MTNSTTTHLSRRAFLQGGTLLLAGWGTDLLSAPPAEKQPGVRFGLVTDLHHADKPSAGSRHYRETLGKLAEAAKQFAQEKIDFVVELGDLIDAADSVQTELSYLKAVNKEFAALSKDRHYVLGNHCVDTLTKREFLDEVGQKSPHYSFDRGGLHFVVLDACFRKDGKPYERKNFTWTDTNLPASQVEWLEADLKAATGKVIVFAHQRLDVADNYGIKNAEAVRKVLEGAKKVQAVFHGHSHKNDYREINGIHYCTLVAMIEGTGAENNGYSTVQVGADGTIKLTGFRKQKAYEWTGR
jgi:alkaline phosphatase